MAQFGDRAEVLAALGAAPGAGSAAAPAPLPLRRPGDDRASTTSRLPSYRAPFLVAVAVIASLCRRPRRLGDVRPARQRGRDPGRAAGREPAQDRRAPRGRHPRAAAGQGRATGSRQGQVVAHLDATQIRGAAGAARGATGSASPSTSGGSRPRRPGDRARPGGGAGGARRRSARGRSPRSRRSSTPGSARTSARSPRCGGRSTSSRAQRRRRAWPRRPPAERQLASWTEERALNAEAGREGRDAAAEAARDRPHHRARSRASATSSAGWRPRRTRTSPAPRPTSRPLQPAAAGRDRRAARPRRGARSAALAAPDPRRRRTCSSGATCARRRPAWWSTSTPSRPGAVVPSGAPVMDIVPDGDRLVASRRGCRSTRSTPCMSAGRRRSGSPPTGAPKAPVVDGEVIYVSADLHRGRARRLLLLRGARQPRPGEPGAAARTSR